MFNSMILWFYGFQVANSASQGENRFGFSKVITGVLCFVLIMTAGCAVPRIQDGKFLEETKGYAFDLPGAEWEIDKDAWVYEREFGEVFIEIPGSKYVLRDRRRRNDPDEDLDLRPRREKKEKRLILDMDIGFKHKTQAMKLLVGTISEDYLIKFLKGKFVLTDSDLPENLVAGYMERLLFLYPTRQPGSITSQSLPNTGTVDRLQWNEEGNLRVIYGIALSREYLFISLLTEEGLPVSEFNKGVQALDQWIHSFVRLPNRGS